MAGCRNSITEFEEGSPETSGDMSFEDDNEVVLNGLVKPEISFMDGEHEEDDEVEEINSEASPDSSSALIPVNRNQCPHCFAQFSLEKNFVEHMWRAHGSRRPFRCDDCGIFLSYRSSLYNHRKIHSDKRPFACPDCSAKFRWNNSLKYHMNRAHHKAMAHISNPDKKIRQKRTTTRNTTRHSKCEILNSPPPAVPATDQIHMNNDNQQQHNQQNNNDNNNLLSLLMATSQQQNEQANHYKAVDSQASTMVEQLRQVVQAMSSATDLLPGDPAPKPKQHVKQEMESTPTRITNRAATIEEVVSSLILSNKASTKDAIKGGASLLSWTPESQPSGSGDSSPQITEHLSRICTQQEALMRRLDTFEHIMQSRMKKTETLLHALLAALSGGQIQP